MVNSIARQGYRLKQIYPLMYQFDKTDQPVSYRTQFIGATPNKDNKAYIDMIESFGHRTFRAPLNQGNLALGKVRIRPFASGRAKVATTFDNFNKEILIVENPGRDTPPLLTSNQEVARQYQMTRNAYAHGLLVALVFLVYQIYRIFQYGISPTSYYTLPALVILTIGLSLLVRSKHRLYQQYQRQARIIE